MKKKLKKIIKQLELCDFECVRGNLSNNESFIELKKLAAQKDPIKPTIEDFKAIISKRAPSLSRREMLATAKACYEFVTKK